MVISTPVRLQEPALSSLYIRGGNSRDIQRILMSGDADGISFSGHC